MKRTRSRRAYKNAVAIAIASFSAVALISTGLAAFVLVRDATAGATGNVIVGEVVDNDITITLNAASGDIKFDAKQNDTTGRIQWNGADYEKLTHTVSGQITLAAGGNRNLNDVNLKYFVNAKKVDGNSVDNAGFIGEFITTNRVALAAPTTALDTDITLTFDASGNFTFDFGFVWGSLYNSLNPSEYYDTPGTGADTTIDDVKTELTALKGAEAYYFDIVVAVSFKAVV